MSEKEFAGEMYDALARRRGIVTGMISKEQLREFWEQLSDQSFDARIQTFFDIVFRVKGTCHKELDNLIVGDMVYGLVHLHELGIIHRDVKPQNVLIANGMTLCAKLSDMGISKCLPPDMFSLSQNATVRELHRNRDSNAVTCHWVFSISETHQTSTGHAHF